MKKRLQSYREKSSSQALVVVLLAVTLLSIIIVGFLLTASLHRSVSRQDYQSQAARALATTGLNSAISQIRTALGPWDDPYNNFCGGNATSAPPTFFWSVSPGIISRWSYTSVAPQTNYPLFSQSAYGDTNLASLNVPSSDGIYPIIGGANPPAIQVYWANVLQSPSYAPASTNRIIGRYAFWVDDESAKININTADGTLKYQTNSLGIGTPSEVSLQVLPSGGTNITATLATNIVYVARTTGFNSVPDILRATTGGTNFDLYTNNVFNLTTCSRSPDLNIFGQPKMALLPLLGDSAEENGNYGNTLSRNTSLLNGITLQPLKEIYPTPSQLPSYPITNVVYSNYWGAMPNSYVPWPMAFQQEFGVFNMGLSYPGIGTYLKSDFTLNHYCWMNGMMLAKYLAGSNAMGQSVTWPVFPGSSSAGFAGKYSPRQIDSVVAQVLSFGAKTISPDYPWSSDSNNLLGTWMPSFYGRRTTTTPFLFPGWLTGQWVNGVGRAPVATSLMMEFTTQGSNLLPTTDPSYIPPTTSLGIWLECWLPAAYLGGNNVIPLPSSSAPITLGDWEYLGVLNRADIDATPGRAAFIPKATATGSQTGLNSFWANQLLTDNQGIDFSADYSSNLDPDQGLAALYHDPWALHGNGTQYFGACILSGGGYTPSPFRLSQLQLGYSLAPTVDWAPGEMRCIGSWYGTIPPLEMQTTANGSTLTIGGGITLGIQMAEGTTAGQDADDVPLESIRGSGDGYPTIDGEAWTSPTPVPGSAQSSPTVRDRALASVIPISFSMQIPSAGDNSGLGNVGYVLARVADPLVNKFPGDWTVTTSTNSAPTTTMQWGASTPASYSEYGSGFHTQLGANTNGIQGDPDSYWLPQADCSFSYLSDLASQTLIPRSARLPNIGYLQYIRTGIIPDDETLPYQPQPGWARSQYQHGTPFRLLSYAPSTETANQETTLASSQPYPDWALLDLLYVPSILAPYGGPYGYYDPNNHNQWTGYGNPSVLANYSTGGGSTPGRINPNGAVIYTTNSTIPVPGISRDLPMQAVLQGLMVNQSLNPTSLAANPANPGFTGGTSVNASISDANSIPVAIENYLRANGPLRMPAELCNVPAIAALRPSVNATRNDLVRQILGALTTQSNVFSVWTVGQTVMKNSANIGYGIFEAGDTVLAETRLHFVVERYLDPGADGVYGNTSNAGVDGVVGTYDDPIDAVNHPFCPHYLYRVIAAEEIR